MQPSDVGEGAEVDRLDGGTVGHKMKKVANSVAVFIIGLLEGGGRAEGDGSEGRAAGHETRVNGGEAPHGSKVDGLEGCTVVHETHPHLSDVAERGKVNKLEGGTITHEGRANGGDKSKRGKIDGCQGGTIRQKGATYVGHVPKGR